MHRHHFPSCTASALVPPQGTIGGLIRMRRTKRAEVDRDGMPNIGCSICNFECNWRHFLVLIGVRLLSVVAEGTKKMEELNRTVKERRAVLKEHVDALFELLSR